MTLSELVRFNSNIKNINRINIGLEINLGNQTTSRKENTSNKKENTSNNKKDKKVTVNRSSRRSSNYYNPWHPEIPAGGRCTTDECALWANDSLRNYKDKKNRSLYTYEDIGGDAWTRLSSGKNSKMLYSGYSGTKYDPKVYSEAASNKRNWDAADRFLREFDSKTLDKNKTYMVNMYYNSSPNKRKAWKNALNGTTGTHTGNVYWNPETNSWRVAHNIHGILHDDDFILVQGSRNKFGYGITAIAEAPMIDYTRQDWNEEHPIKSFINDNIYDFGMWKQGGKLKKKSIPKALSGVMLPEVTVTKINSNHANNPEMKGFIDSLNFNREMFMKKYKLTDLEYADLSRFAVNLAEAETSRGLDRNYLKRKHIPDFIMHLGKIWERGKDSANSRGMTLIKYNDDIKNPELYRLYHDLGVHDLGIRYNPDQMAKATMARAYYIYNKLKNNTYHYTDGSEIPFEDKLGLYWNYGRLTDGVNGNPSTNSNEGAVRTNRYLRNSRIIK